MLNRLNTLTSSTVPVVVATIPLADNTTIGFVAHVTGRQAAGGSAFRRVTACFQRTGGVSALVGASADTDLGSNIAGAAGVWTLVGNDAVLTMTGDGVTAVAWKPKIESV